MVWSPLPHPFDGILYARFMTKPLRTISMACIAVLVATASPLPLVPTAQANDLGSTDFNIAMNLAGLAQSTVSIGALNCSEGGRTFNSTTDMMFGFATDQRIQGQVNMSCRPQLNINSGIRSVSGTMTIPSKGVTDGVFNAECSAKSSMSVVASVAVGAAVPGLLSVNVASASAPLAFSCSFKGSSASKATDVYGTIEGFADVTGMCNSACVAVGMTARATVTAATGELKGQTGSGTYTYTDAFELPELAAAADTLARMKGAKRVRDERISCPEGATDCTIYDSNPCPNGEDTCSFTKGGEGEFKCPEGATCTITTAPPKNASDVLTNMRVTGSRPPSTMNVTLRAGTGDVVILRPVPTVDGGVAALTASQPISLIGPPNAKCTLTLAGKKKVNRSVTLGSTGVANVSYTAGQLTALTRQLGLPAKSKTKPTITVSTTCTSDLGAIPARSRKLQLG